MQTGVMTLTEFLLARIAEDEGDARSLGGELRGVAWQGGAGTPDRVLAEADAKRRIVEWHAETEDCCEERFGALVFDAESEWSAGADSLGNLTMSRSIGTQAYIGCVTLMMLALPYADHPDYRQEWAL